MSSAKQKDNLRSTEHARLRRLILWLCGVGMALSYGFLVPLKLTGGLPVHLTWVKVLAGPFALFSLLAACVVFPRLFPKRYSLAFAILIALYTAFAFLAASCRW